MASKKKLPPIPPPDDDDDDDLEPVAPRPTPDDGDDGTAELEIALAELGGISDATITVTKVTLQGEERLGKYMPREFDVDSLRDRYGGGVYWIYGHAAGKLKTKKRVVLARTLEEARGEAGARTGASPAGDGSMKEVLAQLAQQQREMLQLVLNAMTATRAPATDPMMIISAAEKLANLGNRGNGGDDLERFMRIIKFGREFGRGEGEPGLTGVAMEFASAFREMARQPQQPQPQLSAGAPASEGSPQQMMILIQRALAQQLPMLIRGAQSETDPTVYAQLVLDQLPGPYLEPMVAELQKPEWFTLLVRVDGRVVPHQAWFEALRNEILQATSQSEPPPA